MKWFGQDPQVWMKEGQSPVSEADFAIDQFLQQELLAARPDYGWLSEETDDNRERLQAERVFVVDPIDGTRGFIAGSQQWCISIAVVEQGRPTVGVLECPALQQTIAAHAGRGAWCNRDPMKADDPDPKSPVRVTGPRSFQKDADRRLSRPVNKLPFVPSLAYRIAMIGLGNADLSLARASAKDWDLAAADLIVHEAGGCLTDLKGTKPEYNCEDVRHGALVACAAPDHKEMLDIAIKAMNNGGER
ncbi:MAG: 3'(2'),5'-bisphosphate nucleotidase CysQ [Rhizobiaceae bacterium]|nr:3'(2'),5'-bisphosphate nucleotidase CysQ [Rhizobiaceae bacterium]